MRIVSAADHERNALRTGYAWISAICFGIGEPATSMAHPPEQPFRHLNNAGIR
jgi:hypothetical protein